MTISRLYNGQRFTAIASMKFCPSQMVIVSPLRQTSITKSLEIRSSHLQIGQGLFLFPKNWQKFFNPRDSCLMVKSTSQRSLVYKTGGILGIFCHHSYAHASNSPDYRLQRMLKG